MELPPHTSPQQSARQPLHHQVEQLRRSVAMLSPGESALDRETALTVLHQLQAVSARVERLEHGLQDLLDGVD